MKPAYTNAVTPTVTDWRGISHARMTAAMEDLSPVAYKALGMMRRRWREHESRILTVREAGEFFGCSPATAGRILKELAEYGFIMRSACGLSFVITLLAPPELDERSKFDRPTDAPQSQPRARRTRQRSNFDRPTTHDHDHAQQQQHGEACELPDTPLVRALRDDHANARVITKILQQCPNRTVEDYRHQLALARMRPGVRNPEAFVFGLWMRGEQVNNQQHGGENESDPETGVVVNSARGHAQGVGRTHHTASGDWTPNFERTPDLDIARACRPDFAKLAAEFGDDVYNPESA